ncbi:MAG: L-histidine N(alpha)-methyltransferase [Rhodospirillales bacterium]
MAGQARNLRPELSFAEEVRFGLTKAGQKELPSKYLYDDVGSALFEAITYLPEYGLTRAEQRLLQRHSEEIRRAAGCPALVTELGSGDGRKARAILESLNVCGRLTYYPVDVSAAALVRCNRELSGLGALTVVGLEAPFLEGLAHAAAEREPGRAMLVLFLGSTIGNFDRPAAVRFLKSIRGLLAHGDALLLGTDLQKPAEYLLPAYDDPAGVTAAFNLNLLARINRELGGDFNLRQFEHEARFCEAERRIEMHLRSRRLQTVSIREARITVTLRAGETIWTEACHKFSVRELPELAAKTGFHPEEIWVDEEWPFALNLWLAK